MKVREDKDHGLVIEFDLPVGVIRNGKRHAHCVMRPDNVTDTLAVLDMTEAAGDTPAHVAAQNIRLNLMLASRRILQLGDLSPEAWAYPNILSLLPPDAPDILTEAADVLQKKYVHWLPDEPDLNAWQPCVGSTPASAGVS